MTDIGERGITLSGGQKQRVSIARAIYSGAGIVLLDDPLSAVDANVGKHIFEEAICGLLRDKTVFLATHHMHILSRCDQVIWMIEGRIEARGTFEELMASKPDFAMLLAASGHAASSEVEEEIAPVVTRQDSGQSQKSANNPSNHDQLANLNTSPANQLVRDESEIRDSVSLSVYISWLRSSGSLWNAAPVLIGQVLFRGSSIVGGLWLSWWVDNRYGLTLGQNVSFVRLLLSRSMFLNFLMKQSSPCSETHTDNRMLDWHIHRSRPCTDIPPLHVLTDHLPGLHPGERSHVQQRPLADTAGAHCPF